MEQSLTIRAAQPGDEGVLLELIRALAVYEKLDHTVVATEPMLREALFGERPSAYALVARWGGEVAGFALYFHNFSTFAGRRGLYLEDLFVKPQWRGKGIGKALLAQLAVVARERNCARMEWAVLDWNQSAIDFYRSLGAQILPDWRICRMTGEAITKLAEYT